MGMSHGGKAELNSRLMSNEACDAETKESWAVQGINHNGFG